MPTGEEVQPPGIIGILQVDAVYAAQGQDPVQGQTRLFPNLPAAGRFRGLTDQELATRGIPLTPVRLPLPALHQAAPLAIEDKAEAGLNRLHLLTCL
jgi:hypothetical protein